MVREVRVFDSLMGKPVFGMNYQVVVYGVGAEVAAGSSGDTISVRVGHGFTVGDKGIVGTDPARYFVVGSFTASTLVLANGQTMAVAALEILVNLGPDSGVSFPLFDRSPILIYADMDYSSVYRGAVVQADSSGIAVYHHRGDPRWELILSDYPTPVAIIRDTGGTDSNARTLNGVNIASLWATEGDGTVGSPWIGWELALAPYTTVSFPNGYYLSAAAVTIPAGSTLVGNGAWSRIVFDQTGNTNAGFLNATDAGDITIRDLYIEGGGAVAESANGTIRFSSGDGQNYLFENLFITNAALDGISIVGKALVPTNARVVNVSVVNARRHGVEFSYNTSHSLISGCYIENTNWYIVGSGLYPGSDPSANNITVIGNTVRDCQNNGIRSMATDYNVSCNTVTDCVTDGIRLFGTRQTCTGNTVRGMLEQGIKVEGELGGGAGPATDITVTGNACTGCGESGIQVRYTGSQASRITISGNTCSDNSLHGIHLRGGQEIVVSGNQCNNNSAANIWAEASDSTTLTRVLIASNYCYKVGGTKGNILVSQTGVIPGTIGYIDIIGNVCDGGGTAPYGIGVTHIGSGVNIIDNVCRGHAGGANLSLVVGCFIRHSGVGTAAFATSTAVNGSTWYQTDAAAASSPMSVYENGGWREVTGKVITVGYVASTTQNQAGGTVLKRGLSVIATVANANDTVTLPAADAGVEVTIINNGANTLKIYPALDDNLGAGANTSTTLATGLNLVLVAINSTNWETL